MWLIFYDAVVICVVIWKFLFVVIEFVPSLMSFISNYFKAVLSFKWTLFFGCSSSHNIGTEIIYTVRTEKTLLVDRILIDFSTCWFFNYIFFNLMSVFSPHLDLLRCLCTFVWSMPISSLSNEYILGLNKVYFWACALYLNWSRIRIFCCHHNFIFQRFYIFLIALDQSSHELRKVKALTLIWL